MGYDFISVTLNKVPASVDEARSMVNFKDFNSVAAMAIMAFKIYSNNKDLAIEIINMLKGPASLSPSDIQFLRDRLVDKPYLADSYFKGSTVSNNYTPSTPYVIAFRENPYSRQSEGYITIYVKSAGADSERSIQMRYKPSTGEWFLWAYSGILMGIRIPAKDDAWA